LGALASVSVLKNADKSSDKGVKEPDEDVIINEKELLPNLKNATFAEAKLTKYALDPTSDKGKEKARVFKAALGYEKSNYKDLMQQVYDNLGKFKAVEKGEDQYGTKFEVNMMIHGPNDKTKTS
jgi:ABC-type transporter MlaC component